jgi:hypothetical protein
MNQGFSETDRERFELSIPLNKVCLLSRKVLSTTQPPIQMGASDTLSFAVV